MEFRYEHQDTEYIINLDPQSDGSFLATIGDEIYTVDIQRAQIGQFNLIVDGQHIHAYTAHQKSDQTGVKSHYIALVDRQAEFYELTTPQPSTSRRRGTGSDGGSLTAQMPGQVMQVMVSESDVIEIGQPLMILEAMKMETRVTAPIAGTVKKLLVNEGDTIERGQQLIEIESD
jgi:biotin carboxyl carrier protein